MIVTVAGAISLLRLRPKFVPPIPVIVTVGAVMDAAANETPVPLLTEALANKVMLVVPVTVALLLVP